jgi:lipopolysaccharide/colanic/teichoic acid biosynthesis glycosyltransferase
MQTQNQPQHVASVHPIHSPSLDFRNWKKQKMGMPGFFLVVVSVVVLVVLVMVMVVVAQWLWSNGGGGACGCHYEHCRRQCHVKRDN